MTLVQLRTARPPSAVGGPPLAGGPLVDPQARRIRYLRVSLTDRCNYRCTYCMPEEGIDRIARADLLTLEEVATIVQVFAGLGVERVRLTGGEPTVRRGLVELVAALAAIPIDVVLTTNGARLAEMAAPLRRAGLRGLTVSLDSLDPGRFAAITRRGVLAEVLAGLDAARDAGFCNIKLNTVAIRGFNDHELGELALWAWERGHVPRFIEVMPMSAGRLYVPGELMPAAEIRERIAAAAKAPLESDSGEGVRGLGPATYWRVASGPHAGRRVGVIAPMTENFCASCNRLRLSAAGSLHNCLARDDAGDLRSVLRSAGPVALAARVRAILGFKQSGHTFALDGHGGPDKAMISIGG
ncbi:cyclic pyranopterin monophosphate synthase subunit MoaA [Nannocystis exedens]|uniref:GTP 3',8-cyclase n=1 Tax=Nannocystis exedens TaxID=54 RepID=A0A1I1VRR5_9BACT|nr:GTP 3',8-cyclase MoaA [Nannocystis exedens]PCC72634.1 cyclic pyranopterin phosphate synthase MoaA [Nannocystis exedens]SFD83713.1 cyclic pyranopterin monophosphate synthase subunit MoaA [Nannocystis exedens]